MTDHRRIQRTLLRMQLDALFAAAIFAGDREASASTGLDVPDLELFRSADPRAVAADREGKRRAQFLRNVTAEMQLSLRAARDTELGFHWIEGFLESPEMHRAIAVDERLPFAFAAYAERRVRTQHERHVRAELDARGAAIDASAGLLPALIALEIAMMHARRSQRAPPTLRAGEIAASERSTLIDLPAGAFDLALRLRQAIDTGRELEPVSQSSSAPATMETVLLFASTPISPHRLREVEPERLTPVVAALLKLAREPIGPRELADFAAEHAVEPLDVDAFVASLAEEGVLVRGT